MEKPLEEAPPAPPRPGDGAKDEKKGGGFVREWVVPVVLGLAIGGAGMWVWTHGGRSTVKPLFQSKARTLVERWQAERENPTDPTDEIEGQLKALGTGSRDEMVAVMRDLGPEQIDAKIWVARLLVGEPWFASQTLKEIVGDAKAAPVDRRVAACGLVDMQHKEVDTELVMPVFIDWLKDAADYDRGMAIARVEHLWREGMLNSQWEAKVKAALLETAKRVPTANADEEDRAIDARGSALLALELGVEDPEVKKALWTAAKDEGDAFPARLGAIRALAQGGVLDADTVKDWSEVAKSKDEDVRQAVGDNLQRAKLPEFDAVLEPLMFDSKAETRSGAIASQAARRRPSMLERFDELVEDGDEFVRFVAMRSAGMFKHEEKGKAKRAAMMLRYVESGDDPSDVQGAVLAMFMLTDQAYGFGPTDVHVREQDVEPAALATFIADTAGRKDAAAKWRAHFGDDAVWTDAERAKTLEKLLSAKDPKTVERAKAELAAIKR